jgi:hypothetical protein
LRAVLDGLTGLALLVVDGYARPPPLGRPGSGTHAHADFGVPVIGVAKSRLRTATQAVLVLHGSSARPLFISAAGMPAVDAAELVQYVTGRRPAAHALRRACTRARAGPPAVSMTGRRPDWPTHMCGQASYSHVDHGCGTGLSVSVDGRRLFREPETVGGGAVPPAPPGVQATGLAHRPMRERGSVVLHPAVSATRIERVYR